MSVATFMSLPSKVVEQLQSERGGIPFPMRMAPLPKPAAAANHFVGAFVEWSAAFHRLNRSQGLCHMLAEVEIVVDHDDLAAPVDDIGCPSCDAGCAAQATSYSFWISGVAVATGKALRHSLIEKS